MAFKLINSPKPIETFIINLLKRPERRKNILDEFSYRSEFKVTVVDAVEDSFGALGLWKTLCLIIEKASATDADYIIICEDDHRFTPHYSEKKLRKQISVAQDLQCDVLLGGVSWAGDCVQLQKSLFWLKSFSGLQFTVIFKKFFQKILQADLNGYDAADYKICDLSKEIMLIYPFLSIQRSYPYSDVTPLNNQKGRVRELFNQSAKKLRQLDQVTDYYRKRILSNDRKAQINFDEIILPTYVINLKRRTDRRSHISRQFEGRKEFEINFFEGIVHDNGQVGLWESIRSIVLLAVEKKEDVIILCEDDHEFIQHYDRNFLIENIIKGHSLGAQILLGGISHFPSAAKVDNSLFWVDEFYSTQFTVIYKRFYQEILDAPYDNSITADGMFSSLAVNKLVIFPFISVQKDFGYSDITFRESTEIRQPSGFFDTLARLGFMSHKYNLAKNAFGKS